MFADVGRSSRAQNLLFSWSTSKRKRARADSRSSVLGAAFALPLRQCTDGALIEFSRRRKHRSARADHAHDSSSKADVEQTINDQTGTTYTLQASDSGKPVRCTNASAITVTCPDTIAPAAGKCRA